VRWDLIYSGWSTQQFASALQDRGVGIKKRSLDGHLRTAGGQFNYPKPRAQALNPMDTSRTLGEMAHSPHPNDFQ
jgi:hypothetical protein